MYLTSVSYIETLRVYSKGEWSACTAQRYQLWCNLHQGFGRAQKVVTHLTQQHFSINTICQHLEWCTLLRHHTQSLLHFDLPGQWGRRWGRSPAIVEGCVDVDPLQACNQLHQQLMTQPMTVLYAGPVWHHALREQMYEQMREQEAGQQVIKEVMQFSRRSAQSKLLQN